MYENKGTANGGEGLEVHRAQFVYETAIIMLLALTSMSRTRRRAIYRVGSRGRRTPLMP
jgi:hypothetical protein